MADIIRCLKFPDLPEGGIDALAAAYCVQLSAWKSLHHRKAARRGLQICETFVKILTCRMVDFMRKTMDKIWRKPRKMFTQDLISACEKDHSPKSVILAPATYHWLMDWPPALKAIFEIASRAA